MMVNSPDRLDLTDRLPKQGSIDASTPMMLLMVAVGALMVSTIRFPSSKQPKSKGMLIALGVAGAVWSAAARPAPVYVPPTVTYYPPQPAPSASYFCASSGQFYPYTSYCPEGWQLVQPAYR